MSPPDAGLGELWNSRAASHIAVGRRLLTSSVAGETSLHCVDESVVVFCGHAALFSSVFCKVRTQLQAVSPLSRRKLWITSPGSPSPCWF